MSVLNPGDRRLLDDVTALDHGLEDAEALLRVLRHLDERQCVNDPRVERALSALSTVLQGDLDDPAIDDRGLEDAEALIHALRQLSERHCVTDPRIGRALAALSAVRSLTKRQEA